MNNNLHEVTMLILNKTEITPVMQDSLAFCNLMQGLYYDTISYLQEQSIEYDEEEGNK